jgi:hypothetical protein
MINKTKLVKYFLAPVFIRNGYEIRKTKYNWLCFLQKENNNISVDYDFLPMVKNALEITIIHPGLDDRIQFPVLIDGPEKICWNGGAWMGFDTIDELIGLIEFQSEILEKWVFDFLAGRGYEDVINKINNQRRSRIKEFAKLTQEEQFKIADLDKKLANEIFSRRYYPKKWNLELFESRNK